MFSQFQEGHRTRGWEATRERNLKNMIIYLVNTYFPIFQITTGSARKNIFRKKKNLKFVYFLHNAVAISTPHSQPHTFLNIQQAMF